MTKKIPYYNQFILYSNINLTVNTVDMNWYNTLKIVNSSFLINLLQLNYTFLMTWVLFQGAMSLYELLGYQPHNKPWQGFELQQIHYQKLQFYGMKSQDVLRTKKFIVYPFSQYGSFFCVFFCYILQIFKAHLQQLVVLCFLL